MADGLPNSSADNIDEVAKLRDLADQIPKDPTPDKDGTRTKRTRRSKPRTAKSTPGSGRKKDLTKDLTGAFGSIAVPMFALSQRNPKLAYDAQVLLENAEEMASALNDLAQRNPSVYRALFYFTNASDFSAVATIGMNIAIPILVNHQVLPPPVLGAVTVSAPPPHIAEQQRNATRSETFRPTVMGRTHADENSQTDGR